MHPHLKAVGSVCLCTNGLPTKPRRFDADASTRFGKGRGVRRSRVISTTRIDTSDRKIENRWLRWVSNERIRLTSPAELSRRSRKSRKQIMSWLQESIRVIGEKNDEIQRGLTLLLDIEYGGGERGLVKWKAGVQNSHLAGLAGYRAVTYWKWGGTRHSLIWRACGTVEFAKRLVRPLQVQRDICPQPGYHSFRPSNSRSPERYPPIPFPARGQHAVLPVRIFGRTFTNLSTAFAASVASFDSGIEILLGDGGARKWATDH